MVPIFSTSVYQTKHWRSLQVLFWVDPEDIDRNQCKVQLEVLLFIELIPHGVILTAIWHPVQVLALLNDEIIDDSWQIAGPTVAPRLFQFFLALMNEWTSFGVFGIGQSFTLATFLGFGNMPSADKMCPSKVKLVWKK